MAKNSNICCIWWSWRKSMCRIFKRTSSQQYNFTTWFSI